LDVVVLIVRHIDSISSVPIDCKIGFNTGERDNREAKCRIKIYCPKDIKFNTCDDCSKFELCDSIYNWHVMKGYLKKKYK
jgi:hypothetical protein